MRLYSLLKLQKWTWNIITKMTEKATETSVLPLWLWIAFLIMALIKLWLVGGQTLSAWGGNVHDDRLFVNHAYTLLKGEWLGSYNNLTLAKGLFYPLWIATIFVLGVPLMLAQHLFYIAACVIFVIAVRPLLHRPAMLLLIYAILLFNPISYTDGPMTRVLREGIYPSLTIMVTAGSVGLLARRGSSIKNLVLWAIGLGFVLSAFWLTREESIWLMPLLLTVIGLAVLRLWQTRPTDWFTRLSIYFLPFLIWGIGIVTIAGINLAHYGVFDTVETKSNDFLAAYGALSRVKQANWRPDVPVPQETRLRIYSVSPAFAELRPFLEGDMGKGWSATSYFWNDTIQGWTPNNDNSQSNEISGGWFMWALRDAVAAAGYYSSGASAANYYQRLATEVNAACADGKLDCGPKRASLMPPWHSEYTRPLINAITRSAVYMARFDGFNPKPGPSVGTEDSLIFFRDITGGRLSPTKNQLQVKGWAFNPSSAINLTVRTANGDLVDANIKLLSSPDVYQYFLSRGSDIPNAREGRFEITAPNTAGIYLYIKAGDHLLGKLPLDGSTKSLQSSELQLILDSIDYRSDVFSPQLVLDNFKMQTLRKIGVLYQAVMPVLTVLALLVYIILTVQVFRKRTKVLIWTINTAMLIAIVVRILIISLINISSFWAINTSYLSPAYPLLLIFTALALISYFEPILKDQEFKRQQINLN